MQAATRVLLPAVARPVVAFSGRHPETTGLYRVMQGHLGTFEQRWTDEGEGATLPRFVLEELRGFLDCGIPQKGFAHLYCDTCRTRHLVAFSCKGRGFCPSCGGRRMAAGAANLVDHVLPDHVPIRQWVLTLPYPLRFPLAFDGGLLGAVLRIFTDTVGTWYRRRQSTDGKHLGQYGAVTAIQRASSDLRLNPHFHSLYVDGVYVPDSGGGAPVFHPTPPPEQDDIEAVVHRTAVRVVRFLERRGVIAPAAAPGDGELQVVGSDDLLAQGDALLGRLQAAACAGVPPAGPAYRRAPVRLSTGPGAGPRAMGKLCAQDMGFNLHAARRIAAEDKEGRESLCRYILRPPVANQRLRLLPEGNVHLRFKRPWSDGTTSVSLEPLALIARLAAIVPPPKRHVVRYFGVLSSHSKLRKQIVPTIGEDAPVPVEAAAKPKAGKRGRRSKYIPRRELLS